jgi:hypothetical protein
MNWENWEALRNAVALCGGDPADSARERARSPGPLLAGVDEGAGAEQVLTKPAR